MKICKSLKVFRWHGYYVCHHDKNCIATRIWSHLYNINFENLKPDFTLSHQIYNFRLWMSNICQFQKCKPLYSYILTKLLKSLWIFQAHDKISKICPKWRPKMEKSIDLLVYLWPQKWQKTAGLSIDYCGGGDMWFLNFTKPKIAHNSLNNGVRPVLTPFLDFQFFLTF